MARDGPRENGEQIASWAEEQLGVDWSSGPVDRQTAKDFERLMEGLREDWIRHSGHPDSRGHAMKPDRAGCCRLTSAGSTGRSAHDQPIQPGDLLPRQVNAWR